MFYLCTELASIGDISNWDTGNVTNMNYMFQNCQSLTSLDVSNWDISKATTIGNAFNYCTALVDFKAPKNISANMSVANSTALSHDSLMSIINNLATVTSSKTLTLGTTNKAKLTADELAIATNKGWKIS
jgi:surface protein